MKNSKRRKSKYDENNDNKDYKSKKLLICNPSLISKAI